MNVYPSIYLSIYPSIYLSIYLSIIVMIHTRPQAQHPRLSAAGFQSKAGRGLRGGRGPAADPCGAALGGVALGCARAMPRKSWDAGDACDVRYHG